MTDLAVGVLALVILLLIGFPVLAVLAAAPWALIVAMADVR
jgi:hypothetical protein